MRRVAQALDTGPASLYVYVHNRDELVSLLVDRVAGEVSLPIVGPESNWREQLIDLMIASIKELGRHPGIAATLFANVPTGPNALALTDAMLGLLTQGGLSRQARAWAVDMFGLYIAAAATETTLAAEQGKTELIKNEVNPGTRDIFANLPADRYPNITDLHEELTYGTTEQRTRWSINAMIDGILTAPV